MHNIIAPTKPVIKIPDIFRPKPAFCEKKSENGETIDFVSRRLRNVATIERVILEMILDTLNPGICL